MTITLLEVLSLGLLYGAATAQANSALGAKTASGAYAGELPRPAHSAEMNVEPSGVAPIKSWNESRRFVRWSLRAPVDRASSRPFMLKIRRNVPGPERGAQISAWPFRSAISRGPPNIDGGT